MWRKNRVTQRLREKAWKLESMDTKQGEEEIVDMEQGEEGRERERRALGGRSS